MMITVQQLRADGSVRDVVITTTAQASGLLLEIPDLASGPPLRLVVPWATLRLAAPQAVVEISPHLVEPKVKQPRERPAPPAPPTPPAFTSTPAPEASR